MMGVGGGSVGAAAAPESPGGASGIVIAVPHFGQFRVWPTSFSLAFKWLPQPVHWTRIMRPFLQATARGRLNRSLATR